MEDCSLLSNDNKWPLFTLSNKQAASRRINIHLDRSFCNHAALHFWNKIECSILARHESDHNPFLLVCDSIEVSGSKLFRLKSI